MKFQCSFSYKYLFESPSSPNTNNAMIKGGNTCLLFVTLSMRSFSGDQTHWAPLEFLLREENETLIRAGPGGETKGCVPVGAWHHIIETSRTRQCCLAPK